MTGITELDDARQLLATHVTVDTFLVDTIENDAAAHACFVPLLHGTYWSSGPPPVRRRLRRLLGLPPEPD